jgi:hypothetical protein
MHRLYRLYPKFRHTFVAGDFVCPPLLFLFITGQCLFIAPLYL